MVMQKEFQPLVDDAIARVREYFGKRFLAVYLHGSLNYGDAVAGVSDMDCYIVISGELNDDDKSWISGNEALLQEKYPVINGVHLAVHSAEELKKDAYTRFMLTYNSSLYAGADIVQTLNTEEFGVIRPGREAAKSRLKFAKRCFDEALSGRQPACMGELPENTYYIARKFARYFVIIEGAYLLMSINKFNSFEKTKVLMGLRENYSEFNGVFDLTEKVLINPSEAGITHGEFLMKIRPFVMMMFESISNG